MRDWAKDDQERWGNASLKELTKAFFDILDRREISDNDKVFAPVLVSSVSVRLSCMLGVILPRMKELANETEQIEEVEACEDVRRSADVISVS